MAVSNPLQHGRIGGKSSNVSAKCWRTVLENVRCGVARDEGRPRLRERDVDAPVDRARV